MGSGFSWSKILGQQVPPPLKKDDDAEPAEASEGAAPEAEASAEDQQARKWKGFSFEVESNDDAFSMSKKPGEGAGPSSAGADEDAAMAERIRQMQQSALEAEQVELTADATLGESDAGAVDWSAGEDDDTAAESEAGEEYEPAEEQPTEGFAVEEALPAASVSATEWTPSSTEDLTEASVNQAETVPQTSDWSEDSDTPAAAFDPVAEADLVIAPPAAEEAVEAVSGPEAEFESAPEAVEESEPEFEAEVDELTAEAEEDEEPVAEAAKDVAPEAFEFPEPKLEAGPEEPAAGAAEDAEPEAVAESEPELETEASEPAAEAEEDAEPEAVEASEPKLEAEADEPAAKADDLTAEVEEDTEPEAVEESEPELEVEVDEPAAEAEEDNEPEAVDEPEPEAEAEDDEPAAAAGPGVETNPGPSIPDIFKQSSPSEAAAPEKLRASGSPDFGALLSAASLDQTPMNDQQFPQSPPPTPAASLNEPPMAFQGMEEQAPKARSHYAPEEVPQDVHLIDVSDKRFEDPHAGEHLDTDGSSGSDDVTKIRDCHIDDILRYAIEHKASDVHLTGGLPPMMRLDGELVQMPFTKLSGPDTRRLIFDTLTDEYIERIETTHELDFAYTVKGISRFRFNVYVQRGCIAGALRAIPSKIPSFETLGLPPVIRELSKRSSGLILVTGPTGSGKSTTIASMIDDINESRTSHIVTLEDPIEYLHRHKKCMVNQRELHSDTYSLHNALRAVLREDPDIILVGELRDLETIEAALTLAETGHLVFGTLHTRNAPSTIDRVVDVFPSDQQAQIRVLLGNTLEGVISQQLLPKLGGGRCASLEIMVATPAVKNLIREGKTHQMYSSIETGGQLGMQTMDSSLANFVRMGYCSYEECLMRAVDKENFARLAKMAA